MSSASDFVIEDGILKEYRGPGGDVVVPEGVTSVGPWTFSKRGDLTSITLPDSVSDIGIKAFSGCYNLTSVTLPKGITNIADSVFSSCCSLTGITLPESLTSIGNEAFSYCRNLTSITIPENVTSIGDNTFAHCENLANITIPESVTSIGDWAFQYCKNLTNVTIPESVTSIGDYAFDYCVNLTSVIIQEGVKSIGNRAFAYCRNLTNITIPESVMSIGDGALCGCKRLADADGFVIMRGVLFYYASSGGNLVIPKGVTRIGAGAFGGCEDLTNITIPESVTSIGGSAFSKCKNLTSITIPESVTSIGGTAFSNCESLTSITIPEGVTSIEDGTFDHCENLTDITIPESVTSIGNWAFDHCKNLTSVTIPESVTDIGCGAFSHCNLTSITIPNGVTSIEDETFSYCENLTSITIPENVISIGEIFGDHFPDGLRKCSNDLAPRMNAAAVKRYCPHLWKNLNDKNKAMIYLQYQNAAMKKFYKKNIKSTDYNALSKGILQCLGSKLSKKECASLADFMQSYMANLSGDNLKAMYDKIAAQKNGAAVRENLDANVSLMKKIADAASTPAATSKKEGTDYDIAVWNMGFSDDRAEKAYDLDGKIVRAVLQQDLSLLVVDDATGKISKSIPKRGISPTAYKAAAEDMRANQKAIRTLLKESKGVLYQSYLSAKAEKSDDWCRLWLGNMVVRRIAAMVVWQQGDSFFTLENENLVQVDGMPYTLTEENIRLAHVMEMPRDMVLDWQKFFTAHQRKQLFPQIWEPCYKREDIAADRYKAYPIHWDYLKYKAELGIDVESEGYEGGLFLGGLEGFSVESQNSGESEVIITSIKPTRWDRRTNAIIAYLDRITMYARIAQDDVTVAQYLPQFTLAQITEFIKFAAENNVPSVTALLLEYKNTHFSDFDPMDEFSLEW